MSNKNLIGYSWYVEKGKEQVKLGKHVLIVFIIVVMIILVTKN